MRAGRSVPAVLQRHIFRVGVIRSISKRPARTPARFVAAQSEGGKSPIDPARNRRIGLTAFFESRFFRSRSAPKIVSVGEFPRDGRIGDRSVAAGTDR